MRYVKPLTKTLSVTYDDIEFKKEIYLPPTINSGIEDENYPIYDSSQTYNTGDYVIVDELKTIYRCTADNVANKFPPANPDLWVDYGLINSYKMLGTDSDIGAQTIGKDIEMEIDFSNCDTLGLINTTCFSLDVEHIINVTNYNIGIGDGVTKTFKLWNENIISNTLEVFIDNNKVTDYSFNEEESEVTFTIPPKDGANITANYSFIAYKDTIDGREVLTELSFASYFFDEIKEKTRFILNLDWSYSSELKLKFNGETKIGSLVIGKVQDLGITLMGTKLSFSDNSKIKIDEFTNTREVIRYGHIRQLDAEIVFNNNDFDATAQKISEIIGRNILFIPDESDKFSEMTNIAYIEKFDMPIDNPKLFKTTTTLIGVV